MQICCKTKGAKQIKIDQFDFIFKQMILSATQKLIEEIGVIVILANDSGKETLVFIISAYILCAHLNLFHCPISVISAYIDARTKFLQKNAVKISIGPIFYFLEKKNSSLKILQKNNSIKNIGFDMQPQILHELNPQKNMDFLVFLVNMKICILISNMLQ